GGLEPGNEMLLHLRLELGAKAAGRKVLSGVAALFREREDAGILDVAHDEADVGGKGAGGDGIGDGAEIGAFAGAENAEAQWCGHWSSGVRGSAKGVKCRLAKYALNGIHDSREANYS